MKRTNLSVTRYHYYYPDGLSGGILYGLFMPPGRKMNRNIQGRCFDLKQRPCFFFRQIPMRTDRTCHYMWIFEYY